MGNQLIKLFLVLTGFVFFGLAPMGANATENQNTVDAAVTQLAQSVEILQLGDGMYIIGSYLTEDQINQAQKALVPDSFPGTFKFSEDDFFVVADKATNLVLAVYKQKEEAEAEEIKQMVGHLMASYGIPTTMAHGKIIYWAFDKNGKIDEQQYNESKALGNIDIIATVKFNSSLDLSPGMSNENTEETGSIYYIITSDLLLEKYMKK